MQIVMSMSVPGEPRIQDMIDAARGLTKCRIPQRLPPVRSKPPFNPNTSRPKCSEPSKQKHEVVSAQHNRFTAKNSVRPRSDEQSRPKSANRVKDDLFIGRYGNPSARFPRPDRLSAAKQPSTLPKMMINDSSVLPSKTAKLLITVPVTQRPPGKNAHSVKNNSGLPDQETIKKHEDLEIRQSEFSDVTPIFNESYDKESITSQSDKVMQLKVSWQEKTFQFERMKNELTDRQNAILELYAVMRDTHQKMSSLGEKASLPPSEDLRIMNVTKMTADQLLQLCSESMNGNKALDGQSLYQSSLAIDVNRLYNMPGKLVDTCEQTLLKRKEIIDWFDTLKSLDKGISVNKLSKKINEFNSENEMLKCTLDQVKAEFVKELEEIVLFLRNSVNETMTLQLRTEELTCKMSQLNSLNADLRKQIHNVEQLRSQTTKNRVEELQKELKDEKCKRIFLRDRLSRAEGQVKMNSERASQLEIALEQARSHSWNLERTVQQLHEQNQKLQSDFDKELNTLTESIKDHTVHLEEIADAREKLQIEKEDLEKRLTELADRYNESLKNVKHEMNINVVKLIETEKKYELEVQDKTQLESKVESLRAQLLDAELRLKDAIKQIHEKDNEIGKNMNSQRELETTKQNLHEIRLEIIDYKNGLMKQNEIIDEIQKSYKESMNLQEALKIDLSTKEEYIVELEKKLSLLEQQLQENESKMEEYVEQLSSLKNHIKQLQEDFGEFENLSELHEKINQQRSQLLDTTRQNGELAESLQKKEEELEQLSASLIERENSIEQRDGVIKILSEKEDEQTNIIKILRNNLELRSHADNNLNQQVTEKNSEIDALISDIDMTKQQMSNLDKIILTLQDQTRKASVQRKKDQDKITMLQSKISEYEQYHLETLRIIEAPAPENLDNLIKIIEDELGTPMEPQIDTKDMSKKKYARDRKREKFDLHQEMQNGSHYQPETGNYPGKNLMGNYVKGDNLDRKRAITNIDTQEWMTAPDPGMYNSPATRDLPEHKKSYIPRNLQYISPNQFREDRKYKMFKLAGHRL